MLKNSKKIKYIIALSSLLIVIFSSFSYATSATIDVSPPRGRLQIKNVTQINNVNYVDTADIEVEINAKDDTCADSEIKYYISLDPISKTTELAESEWKQYSTGITENFTLPNLTGSNSIYLALKDANGNTSIIYTGSDLQSTIVYNANGGEMFTSTVGTTVYHGEPFMITMQTPTRENYYFAGWSTNPSATTASYAKGDIIPANVFAGGSKTITLYAVWAQSSNGLVLLSDVAEIGDYVNYPVSYNNVVTSDRYGSKSSYNGWRVISKNIDLDGNESIGTVNLVSAGVPLTFYHYIDSSTSVTALTTNFLTTPYNDAGNYTYRKTGFLPYKSLTETFTNKFTAMQDDGITPKVRSMKAEDICGVTGHTSMSEDTTMDLANNKYENLFENRANYWLASARYSAYLWYVDDHYRDASVDNDDRYEYGVRPVVSLKPNIVVTGTDMVGAWNIEIVE